MNTSLHSLTRLACTFGFLAASTSQAQVSFVGMRQIQSSGMSITLVNPNVAEAQDLTFGALAIQIASNVAPLPPLLSTASTKQAVIVLSNGTAGSAQPEHTLAATLARAGFWAAQPEYRGDNWHDFTRVVPESWKTRPQHVSENIDAVARDRLFPPANWYGML